MTAVVETVAAAQVMRASAVALADLELLASVEDLLRNQERTATAFQRLRHITLIEEFLAAHAASLEASERSHLTNTGGWGDDKAERLHGVAEDAWGLVSDGWFVMDTSWASRLVVVDEALEAGAGYVGRRRRLVGHAVLQSAPVDWSRSGRAA